MRIAGNIAVGVGPSAEDFWVKFRKQTARNPPNVKVSVNPDLTKLRAMLAAERKRQEANSIRLRVHLDRQSVRRAETGLRRIEHTWAQSNFQRAIRVNLYVAGAASLPGLIQGLASLTTGITELSRAALVLPGALAGVGAAFGTAALGIRGVGEALQESGRAMDNATRKARLFREASRGLERAQREVVEALKAANREIEDQQDKLTRNQLSVEQAQLNLQRANQRLAQGGFETVMDWRQAVLDQRQAQLDLSDTVKRSRRDIQDYYDTARRGATETESVKDAVDRLADAMDDHNKKLLESTGVTEKFIDAMANLSPAARDFVNKVRTIGDSWKSLQNAVQDNLFRGLGDDVVELAERRLPLLQRSMEGVAKSLNADIKQILESVGSNQNSAALEKIFNNTAIALDRMRPGIDSFVTGMLRLSEVGSRFLPRLAGAFNSLMDRFDQFIARADADGSLERWIDSGLRTVSSLSRAFGDLFNIFGSITAAYQRATGNMGGIVNTIEKSLSDLSEYLSSPSGQAALVDWIVTARDFMATISESLPGIQKMFGAIGDAARTFAELIFPVFAKLGETLERHAGLVSTIFSAWATYRTIKPILATFTSAYGRLISGAQKYNEIVADSILNADKSRQVDIRGINTKAKLRKAILENRDALAEELKLQKDKLEVDRRVAQSAKVARKQQFDANAQLYRRQRAERAELSAAVDVTKREVQANKAAASERFFFAGNEVRILRERAERADRVVELNKQLLDEESRTGGYVGRDPRTGNRDPKTGRFTARDNRPAIGIDRGPLDRGKSKDIIPQLKREVKEFTDEISVIDRTFANAEKGKVKLNKKTAEQLAARRDELAFNRDAYRAALGQDPQGNPLKDGQNRGVLASRDNAAKILADSEAYREKIEKQLESAENKLKQVRETETKNILKEDKRIAESKVAQQRLAEQHISERIDASKRMVDVQGLEREANDNVAESNKRLAQTQARIGELDDALVKKKGLVRRGYEKVSTSIGNQIKSHRLLDATLGRTGRAFGDLRTKVVNAEGRLGNLAKVIRSRGGGGGFIGLMGSAAAAVGRLATAIGGLGTIGLIVVLDRLADAQRRAGDRAAYHRNELQQLANTLDQTTGAATYAATSEALRRGQESEITGKNNKTITVDALEASVQAGVPVDLLRRSLDPTQIDAINQVQKQYDEQTLAAVQSGKDEQWNKHGEELTRYGVTAEVYAKAINGDQDAVKKFNQAVDKMFESSFLGNAVGPLDRVNRALAERTNVIPELGRGAENLNSAGVGSVAAGQFQREALGGFTAGGEKTKALGTDATFKPGNPFPGAQDAQWDGLGTGVGFVMNNLTPAQVKKYQEMGVDVQPGNAPGRYILGITGDLVDQWVNPRQYAAGGAVWGAGSSTSDSIPALLSNGEYVINAKSASIIGQSRLDKLNSIQKFNEGGSVDKEPAYGPFIYESYKGKASGPNPLGDFLAGNGSSPQNSLTLSPKGKANSLNPLGDFLAGKGSSRPNSLTLSPSPSLVVSPPVSLSDLMTGSFSRPGPDASTQKTFSTSNALGDLLSGNVADRPASNAYQEWYPRGFNPEPQPKGPVVEKKPEKKPDSQPHYGLGVPGPGGKRSEARDSLTQPPPSKPVQPGRIPTYEQLPTSGPLFDITDPSLSPAGGVPTGNIPVGALPVTPTGSGPVASTTVAGDLVISGTPAERMTQFAAIADTIRYDQGQVTGNNFNLQGIDCTGLALAFANIGLGKAPFEGGRVGLGPEKVFWTGNIGSELSLRGFQPGFVPGALNIGWNHNSSSQHAGMTLPDGTRIDAQNEAAGVVVGEGSPGAETFSNVMHLPIELMNSSSPLTPSIVGTPQNTPSGPISTIPDISTATPPPGTVVGPGGGGARNEIPGVNAPLVGPFGEIPFEPFDILRQVGEAILGAILGFFGIDASAIFDTVNNIFGGMPKRQEEELEAAIEAVPEENPNPNVDPGPDPKIIDDFTRLAAEAKARGDEALAREYLARAGEYQRSRMINTAPPSTLGGLTLDSSRDEVAKAILSEARARGYTKEQAQAILGTAIFESGGLDPKALDSSGKWRGIFRNPTGDVVSDSINDPNFSISTFFDRLDQQAFSGGDIFDTIYWLQNKPDAENAEKAKEGADLSYLNSIRSPSVLNSAKSYMESIGYSRGGLVRRFNTGGAVGDVSGGGTASEIISFAESQAKGQPYVYGGYGSTQNWVDPEGKVSNKVGYDCSGITGSIWAKAFGLPPSAAHYFNTESDFESLGFIPGYQPGAYNIGVMRGGGGPNSHMSGTLPNGVSVESAGSKGTVIGDAATPANEFPLQWHLPVGDNEVQSALMKGAGGVMAGYFLGRSIDPKQYLGYKDGGFARGGLDQFGDPLNDPWPYLDQVYGSNLPGSGVLWPHGVITGDPMTNANGGYIRGPGTATSDSIPALLSNGEYVIRASAVKAIGKSNLDALNSVQGFNEGGEVTWFGGPKAKKEAEKPKVTWFGGPKAKQDLVTKQPEIGWGERPAWMETVSRNLSNWTKGSFWLEKLGVDTETEAWNKPTFNIPFLSDIGQVMSMVANPLNPASWSGALSAKDLVDLPEIPDIVAADAIAMDPNASFGEKMGALLYGAGIVPGGKPLKLTGGANKGVRSLAREYRPGRGSQELALDYAEKISDEFHEWAAKNADRLEGGNSLDYSKPMGGPLTYWGNIEKFFKDRYPEAYRGFNMAEEKAVPLMDKGRAMWSAETMKAKPYETGQAAMDKLGYDPKSLAAAMMYLHTWSHAQSLQNSFRGDKLPRDIERLSSVFQIRQQMRNNQGARASVAEPPPPPLKFNTANEARTWANSFYPSSRSAAEGILSPDQIFALLRYTDNPTANNALRAIFSSTDPDDWVGNFGKLYARTLMEDVPLLDAAMDAYPKTTSPLRVFHNMPMEYLPGPMEITPRGWYSLSELEDILVGRTIDSDGYLSTSLAKIGKGSERKASGEIVVPPGARGIWAGMDNADPEENLSNISRELELLLDRGNSIKIDGVEAIGEPPASGKFLGSGGWRFHGSLIQPEKRPELPILPPELAQRFESWRDPFWASGGYVSGPGSGTSDSIPAMLSNGEYVIKASSVKAIGKERLDALNSVQKFAPGGLVGNPLLPPPLIPPPTPPPPVQSVPAGGGEVPTPPPPSDDPLDLSNVPELTKEVSDAIVGTALSPKGGGSGGSAKAGAPKGKDPRSVLAEAPASSQHLNPAFDAGIKGIFNTAGSIAGTAVQAGVAGAVAGGSFGAAAPAAGMAGSAAASLVSAGIQAAGDVAAGAANVISALGVGTVTPSQTGEGYGAPLLPQQQTQPVNNFQSIHNGNIMTNNLSEYSRLKDRKDAQKSAPFFNRVGS